MLDHFTLAEVARQRAWRALLGVVFVGGFALGLSWCDHAPPAAPEVAADVGGDVASDVAGATVEASLVWCTRYAHCELGGAASPERWAECVAVGNGQALTELADCAVAPCGEWRRVCGAP